MKACFAAPSQKAIAAAATPDRQTLRACWSPPRWSRPSAIVAAGLTRAAAGSSPLAALLGRSLAAQTKAPPSPPPRRRPNPPKPAPASSPEAASSAGSGSVRAAPAPAPAPGTGARTPNRNRRRSAADRTGSPGSRADPARLRRLARQPRLRRRLRRRRRRCPTWPGPCARRALLLTNYSLLDQRRCRTAIATISGQPPTAATEGGLPDLRSLPPHGRNPDPRRPAGRRPVHLARPTSKG